MLLGSTRLKHWRCAALLREDSQHSILGAWLLLLLLLHSCCEHAAVKQADMRFPLIPFDSYDSLGAS
jgi:hypothetical protein